jgi:hypothetical protein
VARVYRKAEELTLVNRLSQDYWQIEAAVRKLVEFGVESAEEMAVGLAEYSAELATPPDSLAVGIAAKN